MLRGLFKYLLRTDPPVPRQLTSGYLEWRLIRSVLQQYAVNCIFDVGANKGQYARNLRITGHSGWICSFEPIKNDFAILSQAFRRDSRWKGFNFALGCTETALPLHVPEESSAMSSFLMPRDTSWNIHSELAELKRLDAIFTDIVAGIEQPRIFLKMDTQGYDLEVIKGAASCLDQITCIQSELSVTPVYDNMPHYVQVIEYYEQCGFQLAGLFDIFRDEQKQTIFEMNCIMVRPDRVVHGR